jgi:hypothetical protein
LTGYGSEVEVTVIGFARSKLLTLLVTDATKVPVFGVDELKLKTSKALTDCASDVFEVLFIYPL